MLRRYIFHGSPLKKQLQIEWMQLQEYTKRKKVFYSKVGYPKKHNRFLYTRTPSLTISIIDRRLSFLMFRSSFVISWFHWQFFSPSGPSSLIWSSVTRSIQVEFGMVSCCHSYSIRIYRMTQLQQPSVSCNCILSTLWVVQNIVLPMEGCHFTYYRCKMFPEIVCKNIFWSILI